MAMAWHDILEVVRRLGSKVMRGGGGHRTTQAVPFTAQQLALAAGFEDTQRSSAADIAAGYISKFRRWGYVKPCGKVEPWTGGRRVTQYALTVWGLKFQRKKK